MSVIKIEFPADRPDMARAFGVALSSIAEGNPPTAKPGPVVGAFAAAEVRAAAAEARTAAAGAGDTDAKPDPLDDARAAGGLKVFRRAPAVPPDDARDTVVDTDDGFIPDEAEAAAHIAAHQQAPQGAGFSKEHGATYAGWESDVDEARDARVAATDAAGGLPGVSIADAAYGRMKGRVAKAAKDREDMLAAQVAIDTPPSGTLAAAHAADEEAKRLAVAHASNTMVEAGGLRRDRHGIAFNATFCAKAKDPFYSDTNARAGQWKKRVGVRDADYDKWYTSVREVVAPATEATTAPATEATTAPATEATRRTPPDSRKVAAAFGGQQPSAVDEEDEPDNIGDLMAWVSNAQAEGLVTTEQVQDAPRVLGLPMDAVLNASAPEYAENCRSVYRYLNALGAGI